MTQARTIMQQLKLHYFFSIILLICLIFSFPSTSYAASKEVDIPIESTYENCTFSVTLPTVGTYYGSLISPDGSTYTFDFFNSTTLSSTVHMVQEGTWKAIISNDDLSEIGRIQISVSTLKEDSEKDNKNIQDKKISTVHTPETNNPPNDVLTQDNDNNVPKQNFFILNQKTFPLLVILIIAILVFLIFRKYQSENAKKNNSEDDIISVKLLREASKEVVVEKNNSAKPNLTPTFPNDLKQAENTGSDIEKVINPKEDDNKSIQKIPFQQKLIENKSFIIYIAYVIFLIVLFQKVILLGVVASESMEPNIITHDICISNRLAYSSNSPKRFDIVTFKKDDETWTKRIIGLPGDEISFQNGDIYINGELLNEPYLDESIKTNCSKTFHVPENQYFLLGDNREYSNDSRFWKTPYITESDIIGKKLFVIPLHNIF